MARLNVRRFKQDSIAVIANHQWQPIALSSKANIIREVGIGGSEPCL